MDSKRDSVKNDKQIIKPLQGGEISYSGGLSNDWERRRRLSNEMTC